MQPDMNMLPGTQNDMRPGSHISSSFWQWNAESYSFLALHSSSSVVPIGSVCSLHVAVCVRARG